MPLVPAEVDVAHQRDGAPLRARQRGCLKMTHSLLVVAVESAGHEVRLRARQRRAGGRRGRRRASTPAPSTTRGMSVTLIARGAMRIALIVTADASRTYAQRKIVGFSHKPRHGRVVDRLPTEDPRRQWRYATRVCSLPLRIVRPASGVRRSRPLGMDGSSSRFPRSPWPHTSSSSRGCSAQPRTARYLVPPSLPPFRCSYA